MEVCNMAGEAIVFGYGLTATAQRPNDVVTP